MIQKISHLFEIIDRIIGKLNYLSAYCWKVQIGKGGNFYGRTYFNKRRKSSIKIGENCTFRSSKTSNWIGINHPCLISTQSDAATIHIGNNCGFSGTVIAAFKRIYIGDNVRCGANTLITDSDWHLDDIRVGLPKDIHIENNVWLGFNAVVLKGVRIGENSIIGANSLVLSDIPANVIAAGNPCKVIKSL